MAKPTLGSILLMRSVGMRHCPAKPRKRFVRTALVVGMLLGALAGVAPVQAAAKISYLQVNSVTPNTSWAPPTLTLDIPGSTAPKSVDVNLSLDSQCPNAMAVPQNQQGYAVLLPATSA